MSHYPFFKGEEKRETIMRAKGQPQPLPSPGATRAQATQTGKAWSGEV